MLGATVESGLVETMHEKKSLSIISVGGTSLLPDFTLSTVKVNGASLVSISAGRFSA